MYKLEKEIREVFNRIRSKIPKSKDDVRAVLLERKLENLKKWYTRLRKLERGCIKLMAKVNYKNISPKLVYVSPETRDLWFWYRNILSSAPFTHRPGRALYLFCIDANTNGIIGVLDIGSDVLILGPREKYIGWTLKRRNHGGLNFLANVGTCVCVAPFGLLTGGKYQIVAITSNRIRKDWHNRYGEKLAGMCTTSLFGKSSIYNRVKEWEYIGDTPGGGVSHINEADWKLIRAFMKENNLLSRAHGFFGMDSKLLSLFAICNALHIPNETIKSQQQRGVYMSLFAKNSLSVLRGESKQLRCQVNRPENSVRDWWLNRWYSMRLPKKIDEIQSFDFNSYLINSQIKHCESVISGASKDSVATVNPDSRGRCKSVRPAIST